MGSHLSIEYERYRTEEESMRETHSSNKICQRHGCRKCIDDFNTYYKGRDVPLFQFDLWQNNCKCLDIPKTTISLEASFREDLPVVGYYIKVNEPKIQVHDLEAIKDFWTDYTPYSALGSVTKQVFIEDTSMEGTSGGSDQPEGVKRQEGLDISLGHFAKPCVAIQGSVSVKDADDNINVEDKDCKSSPVTFYPQLSVSEMIARQVELISRSCNVRGGTASIQDFEGDDPTYLEAFTLFKKKRVSEEANRKLVLLSTFFQINEQTRTSTLKQPYLSVWNIIKDLFKSAHLYGYKFETRHLRSRMLNVWYTYSYRTSTLNPFKTIEEFDNSQLELSTWMKVVKYKLAAFAAYAKGSTVYPKCPFEDHDNPSILLDKDFTSWFKHLPQDTLQQQVYRMSLIDTLCRGVKKGTDRSTDDDCLMNCYETFKLFTEPKSKPTYLDITVQDMEQEIIRSVDEIIGDSNYEPKYNLCPSFSSCSENSLLNGGHVAIVKNFIPRYPREPIVSVKYGMLKDPFPLDGFNNTDEENPLTRTRLPSIDEDSFEAIRKIGEGEEVQYLEVATNPDNLGTDLDIDALFETCFIEDNFIKVVGLKEALKVRGITTPAALETYLLKPLQKFLAKCLLKHLCFAVTGAPLTPEHLERVLVELHDNEVLTSGDYDNATNMMISSYTEVCLNAICNKIGIGHHKIRKDGTTKYNNIRRVIVNSLCHNHVELCRRFLKDGKRMKQTIYGLQQEAQPMGKILSFTVLCIINFSVCRKAIELDRGYKIPIAQFPGLINGDDCCFPISNFDHWVGCSSMVGLFNSIGKTFTSRGFVEMNSRTFLVNFKPKVEQDRLDISSFTEIPFVNFGLMKGLVRSEGGENKKTTPMTQTAEAVTRMGWCHSQLVKGFDALYEELDFLFKFYHNKYLLSEELKYIPYYVPNWLGGLGLDPGPDFTSKVSINQLQCAHFIYQHYELMNPSSMSLTKTCLIDSLINKQLGKWFHDFAIKETIHDFQTLVNQNDQPLDLQLENQAVYSDLVEYLWRTRNLNQFFTIIDDNFVKVQEKMAKQNLIKNKTIWQRAFSYVRTNQDYKPLKWYKLWHNKQPKVKPVVAMDRVKDYAIFIRELAH